MALRVPCPHGFDFPATVGVIRRGPNDPLNRWDGVRWRRLFAVDGSTVLLEAEVDRRARGQTDAVPPVRARLPAAVPYRSDRADARGQACGLVVRRREGWAPPPLVRRLVGRIFGLDDPGPAFGRRIPARFRRLIRGHAGMLLPGYPSLFEALVHTVLGQQLHVLVANRHREAFVHAFGASRKFSGEIYWTFPEPRHVAQARMGPIRRIGASRVKAGAILAIARSLESGRLSEDRLAALPAAEAIAELSTLPGVGRWTSEWVLLRALRRFEIVPAGDLAVRKAVTWALGTSEVLTEQQVRDAAVAWSPYGGLVAYRLLAAYRRTIG